MKKIILASIFIALMSASCSNIIDKDPDSHSSASLARFRAGEIQEYQGKLLSPAVGPRDNSIKGIQDVDIDNYTLRVTGLVNNEITMNYAQVLEMTSFKRLITLFCVEGWDATILWEGVSLVELINNANPRSEAVTVIFHAADGYTTSLPWSVVKEKQLILAYKANEIVLPPEMGYPFIVVAEDKLGYKWARWVTKIELSDNKEYKGYWESRGYTNEANIPG
ncbi:MAG: molybdopterin-dependent oxidoreductase [Erysipelothrix sp.]|nr:molybdopterin-dependent oxidoreductase [Erysipelothrix sp.]